MPGVMHWLSPPTRREVTLLIFSLTVFILSYNLETSLQLVGLSPSKISSSYLGAVLHDPGFERDGRRPQAWRDKLETIIAGDWVWEEGEIAGVKHGKLGMAMGSGTGQRTIYNVGKNRKVGRSAIREDPGVGVAHGVTVDDQFMHLDNEIPETRTVAHIPGFTILDNLYMLNGTMFIVTDSPGSVPSLSLLASASTNARIPPPPEEWRVLTIKQANATLGDYVGRLRQTTWLATERDTAQDPYTLFSFLRAHNVLTAAQHASQISDSGLHILSPSSVEDAKQVPPPVRLWFPRIPLFSTPEESAHDTVHNAHPPPRQRSYNGLHPNNIKAVLPTVGVMYEEDWEEYANMHIPFLFERVLVVDRAAAQRNRDFWSTRWIPMLNTHDGGDELRKRQQPAKLNQDNLPSWGAPFVGFDAAERWWAPARAAMLSYLGLPSDAESTTRKTKLVVTIVSMEEEPYEAGGHIRTEDFPELADGLRKFEKDGVISEFHIVKGNGTKESWEERMKIMTRTDILLGAFGHALADSLFLPAPLSMSAAAAQSNPRASQPSPLVMEFWPTSAFSRDREFSVRSLGMRYLAWWDEKKFVGSSMPPVMGLRSGQSMWVTAVVPMVLEEIRAEAEKWTS